HGGEDVGHARAGNDETDARLPRHAGIAVRHEASALLMARRDMAHAAVGQPAIELHRMDPWDAENRVDAIGFQQFDDEFAACGHGRFSRTVWPQLPGYCLAGPPDTIQNDRKLLRCGSM